MSKSASSPARARRRPPAPAPTPTSNRPPPALVLTGIVTTNDVIVSPQIAGQIGQLLVNEGDVVKKDQLLAVIAPDELQADTRLLRAERRRAVVAGARVARRRCASGAADRDQIRQAESTLASTEAQVDGGRRRLENARLTFDAHAEPVAAGRRRRRRSSIRRAPRYDAAQAQARRAQEAGRGAARDRRAGARRTPSRSPCGAARCRPASTCRRRPPRSAPRPTCGSPTPRSTRRSTASSTSARRASARSSTPGQPIVTLINPDDLWVRADVEETYIDRVRIGDTLTVRLPSGAEREGTVFYRGADAAFATQRDVSRTKRDIKTFEVRLRVDNTRPPARRRHDGLRAAAASQ